MLRSKFVSQSSLLRTIPGERASKVARKMSPPRGGDISIWENWGHFNLGLTYGNARFYYHCTIQDRQFLLYKRNIIEFRRIYDYQSIYYYFSYSYGSYFIGNWNCCIFY